MPQPLEEPASDLLDVVPIVMRDIRSEMRSRRSHDLTVPQFRALLFLNRNKGSSLLDVAKFMGLASPSVCRLIDALVSREFVTRNEHPEDRRRLKLTVTDHGRHVLEICRKGTLAHLSERLSLLAPEEREAVVKALRALRSAFADRTREVV